MPPRRQHALPPLNTEYRPPMSYAPLEVAPAIVVFGRNFLRLLASRGELTAGFVERVNFQAQVDLFDLPSSNPRSRKRLHPLGHEVRLDTVLKAMREVARTPFEAVDLGDTAFARNFHWLAAELGLSDAEKALLLLAIAMDCSAAFTALAQLFEPHRLEDLSSFVSALTLAPLEGVRVAIAESGVLRRSGLLSLGEPYGPRGLLLVDKRVSAALLEPSLDRETTLARFLRKEAPATLQLEDYGSLAPTLGAVVRLLEAARRRREKGINVLFYGPTGVGKTEAARLVAQRSKQTLYLAGDGVEGECWGAGRRPASSCASSRRRAPRAPTTARGASASARRGPTSAGSPWRRAPSSPGTRTEPRGRPARA